MSWQKRPDSERLKRVKKSKPVIFQLRIVADEIEERQRAEQEKKARKKIKTQKKPAWNEETREFDNSEMEEKTNE